MINPAIALSIGRIGIGAAALAAPDKTFQGFMLDPRQNPQQQFVMRMFGSREIALGIATLASIRSGRKEWLLAGIAIDSADALAGYLTGSSGAVPRAKGGMLAGAAAGAALLGALGLRATTPLEAGQKV